MNPSALTSDQILDDCSARLWAAEVACTPTALLSSSHPELDVSDAYAIQAATLRRRGMPAVGFKLGYTSAAMRAQMNIDQPNFGVLTEAHRLGVDGRAIDRGRLIHPRVEPEIALRLGRELAGAGHDRASVSRHLDAVMPALEVVDTLGGLLRARPGVQVQVLRQPFDLESGQVLRGGTRAEQLDAGSPPPFSLRISRTVSPP